MTTCLRCDKPSTGVLIQLCDDHFDEWVAEIHADPKAVDLAPIDPRVKYQSGGGVVPDDVEAIVIHTIPVSLN